VRLLVQSLATGRFLVPSLDDGMPEWVVSLRDAGGGVVADEDSAIQLVEDHCEPDDRPIVLDLDRLGTFDDYEAAPTGSGMRSVPALVGAARSAPHGNHGDNEK